MPVLFFFLCCVNLIAMSLGVAAENNLTIVVNFSIFMFNLLMLVKTLFDESCD